MEIVNEWRKERLKVLAKQEPEGVKWQRRKMLE